MSRLMPKSVISLLFKTGTVITAEIAKPVPEVRAMMQDEVVSIPTINAGGKSDREGNTIYRMVNEIITFNKSELMFWSLAEVEPGSDLVIPRKPGIIGL